MFMKKLLCLIIPVAGVCLGSSLLGPVAIAQSLGGSGITADAPVVQASDLIQKDDSARLRREGSSPPFGSLLFNGGFSGDGEDGLNRNYIVQPGDRVSVRIWGATQFNEQLTVDHQGNIFLPSVGPIQVAGTPNSSLNDRVANAVGKVFTDDVKVYTNLDGTQPVAVFVTGYVSNPGRFAGIPSNSALYYLDRAGGVDSLRGSFRNVRIVRNGEDLAVVDLYDFMLEGVMPDVQFKDGDTIVVGARGNVVDVSGSVANAATFEFGEDSISGADALELAQIDTGVNYVGLSGIRAGKPMALYLTLEDFRSVKLRNGDSVNFQTDQHDLQIVVTLEGSHLGPSRYSVPAGTRLNEFLDYVEVDPVMADIGSISLKRTAIAARQKEALEEGLRRLEASYLTASSQTDEESAIRIKEAELISRFVERARRVVPNGRLVVASNNSIANVVLKQGDIVTIPTKSDSILLGGEVLVSQAMLFTEGRKARDYIESSGGFTRQAETKRLVIVHANGEVSTGANPRIRQGDEIMVLPKVPVKSLQIAATIVDIIYKVAVAASVAIQL